MLFYLNTVILNIISMKYSVLDIILPKYSDFRRCSTKIVNLYVIPKISNFRPYSTNIQWFSALFQ